MQVSARTEVGTPARGGLMRDSHIPLQRAKDSRSTAERSLIICFNIGNSQSLLQIDTVFFFFKAIKEQGAQNANIGSM